MLTKRVGRLATLYTCTNPYEYPSGHLQRRGRFLHDLLVTQERIGPERSPEASMLVGNWYHSWDPQRITLLANTVDELTRTGKQRQATSFLYRTARYLYPYDRVNQGVFVAEVTYLSGFLNGQTLLGFSRKLFDSPNDQGKYIGDVVRSWTPHELKSILKGRYFPFSSEEMEPAAESATIEEIERFNRHLSEVVNPRERIKFLSEVVDSVDVPTFVAIAAEAVKAFLPEGPLHSQMQLIGQLFRKRFGDIPERNEAGYFFSLHSAFSALTAHFEAEGRFADVRFLEDFASGMFPTGETRDRVIDELYDFGV